MTTDQPPTTPAAITEMQGANNRSRNSASSNANSRMMETFEGILSSFQPSPSTNYLSLAIGYSRQAIHPAVTQWSAWTGVQRMIAACILLPLLAAPLMTIAFCSPLIVGGGVGCYVVLYGWEVSSKHYREAVKEHFGEGSLSLESFKRQAEGFKGKAEASQYVQLFLQYASLGFQQVLVGVVMVLDYIIMVPAFILFIY